MTEEVAAAILALAETIERARLDDELGESYPGAGDVSARDKVQARYMNWKHHQEQGE